MAAAAGFAALYPADFAFAHASERGHVLLLPTGHYLLGGAAAVAASFAALLWVPNGWLRRAAAWRLPLGETGDRARFVTSAMSVALLALLTLAGLHGSRDPLSNPLPLAFWTLFWVGLTLVQGLLGNLWHWLDPWYAPWRIARALGLASTRALPARTGYWPALALFAAFAWFELIDPAPDDPARLAAAVAVYWAATLVAMLVFGHTSWSRRGEALSAFWRMLSKLGIVDAAPSHDGRIRVSLRLPGAGLRDVAPLPLSGTLFLLLALASVSFDGLSRTFAWLDLIGVNPLEFPGRSAVVGVNTAGLFATFAVLAAAFFGAVALGQRLAGRAADPRAAAGLLVWSIVPIALAYHFSHYLTALAVNGQYALVALSDPFGWGWNLFGTAGWHVEAGLLSGHAAAWFLWNLQALAIVAGHVLAVLIAHGLAHRLYEADAVRTQVPLTALMVLYTLFGLWLLSTPTAG